MLTASDRGRQRWLSGYVDQLVSRDLRMTGSVRDPVRLRRYLQAVPASTAGSSAMKTLAANAGIDLHAATAYDALLEGLLVTEPLAAGPQTDSTA